MTEPNSCKEIGANLYDVRRNSISARYFDLSEFRCNDGTPILLLHNRLLRWLDVMRRRAGSPIIVNSGYRTHAYNEQIDGSDNSRHMYGLAADIKIRDMSPEEVADWAEELEFGGVGRYDSFTHVDVWKKNRRWDKTKTTNNA